VGGDGEHFVRGVEDGEECVLGMGLLKGLEQFVIAGIGSQGRAFDHKQEGGQVSPWAVEEARARLGREGLEHREGKGIDVVLYMTAQHGAEGYAEHEDRENSRDDEREDQKASNAHE
jgi:hypothetical protein